MWSEAAAIEKQGEGDLLIKMIDSLDLQLFTPQGEMTYLELKGSLTVNLIFASEELVDDFIKWKI